MQKDNDLQQIVAQWGRETFPESTVDTIWKHFQEEYGELNYAVKFDDNIPEEAADCLLILFHLADRLGFDLLAEARKKFYAVKDAEWVDDGRGYRKRVK